MLSSKDKFLHLKRQFNENVFILVKKGELNITSNNKNYKICQNQFIFLNANELHYGNCESNGPLEYYWVHIKDTFNQTDKTENKNNCSYFFSETGNINNSNKINLLFNQLLDFYMNDKSNQLILNYALSLLFLELTSEICNNNFHQDLPPMLYNALSWIKANYSSNLSVNDISKQLNCSSANLSFLFKKYLNTSIIQYLNKIRIDAAKNLLVYFEYSIKECAFECGFEDEKYFMKVFKNIEGITPTEYKKTFYKKNINKE